MKILGKDKMVTAALLFVLGLVVAGCGPQSGKMNRPYGEDLRFVPGIHLDNTSFGVFDMQYRDCFYDQAYNGYWCPRR